MILYIVFITNERTQPFEKGWEVGLRANLKKVMGTYVYPVK